MKPLFSIWINPKKTFEYLVKLDDKELNTKLDITLLLISFSTALQGVLHDLRWLLDLGIIYSIIIGLMVATFIFVFLKYINAYVLLLISRLFQGKADISRIRIAMTYSLVPLLFNLFVAIPLITVSIVLNNTEVLNYQNSITHFIIGLISLRILIIGLAFYNKYSYGYALLTFLIPASIAQLLVYYLSRM